MNFIKLSIKVNYPSLKDGVPLQPFMMEIALDKRDNSIVSYIELVENKVETLRKELPQYDIQYYGKYFKFDGRTYGSTRKEDDYFVIYDEGVFETFNREEFEETFDRNLKDF